MMKTACSIALFASFLITSIGCTRQEVSQPDRNSITQPVPGEVSGEVSQPSQSDSPQDNQDEVSQSPPGEEVQPEPVEPLPSDQGEFVQPEQSESAQPYADGRPNSDRSGDFNRKTSHQRWIVTDSDPNGLNCRWSSAMPVEWYSPAASLPPLNVNQWSVVKRFPKGTVLSANITPAGFATLSDTRQKPWLKVSIGDNDRICLVRANQRFVRPIN